MRYHTSLLLPILIVAGLISGCSLKYAIDEPKVSGFSYQNVDKKPLVMKVVDQRDDKNFSPGITGLKRVDIVLENVNDPVAWLSTGIEKEFTARGVPLKIAGQDAGQPADMTLTVKKYQVVNHRASGFSAWEAYHLFLGQLTVGNKTCTIPAYFFNSKIPVWSMNEVKEPCLNIPMSLMVKEIVSKINRCAFNYSASDEEVSRMAADALAKVKPETDFACMPSIELGSTNNLLAMKTLEKIAEDEDSFVKTCAVTAMGTLGDQNRFDYLVGKYDQFTNNDKAIPLKAIGDIGTDKALDFVRKVKTDKLYEDENSVKYCVDLYTSN